MMKSRSQNQLLEPKFMTKSLTKQSASGQSRENSKNRLVIKQRARITMGEE